MMILHKGRGFLNKFIVEKLMGDKFILEFAELNIILGLNTWIKAEAAGKIIRILGPGAALDKTGRKPKL